MLDFPVVFPFPLPAVFVSLATTAVHTTWSGFNLTFLGDSLGLLLAKKMLLVYPYFYDATTLVGMHMYIFINILLGV